MWRTIIARIEKIKIEWRKCSAKLEKGDHLRDLGLVHYRNSVRRWGLNVGEDLLTQ
jgi:hypothetical protein